MFRFKLVSLAATAFLVVHSGQAIASVPNSVIPLPSPSNIASVPDLAGWRNTQWGMSIAQVQVLYPFVGNIVTAPDGKHKVGKSHAEVDGHMYDINFVFLDGLESVNLSWKPSGQDKANSILNVANSLRSRYGKPDDVYGDPSIYLSLKWNLPSTIIDLTGNNQMILVGYEKQALNKGF
jgi:hypothetical protein